MYQLPFLMVVVFSTLFSWQEIQISSLKSDIQDLEKIKVKEK